MAKATMSHKMLATVATVGRTWNLGRLSAIAGCAAWAWVMGVTDFIASECEGNAETARTGAGTFVACVGKTTGMALTSGTTTLATSASVQTTWRVVAFEHRETFSASQAMLAITAGCQSALTSTVTKNRIGVVIARPPRNRR
jgi:hypothetical protein